ncbi:MAG: zf-HC2 domain-containing protein [Gaiellales bacterium]
MPSELDPICQAARVWISAAVDGEASVIERAAVRAHVVECASCAEWAALAESLVLHVRTAEPARPTRPLVLPPPAPIARPRRSHGRVAVAVALGVAAISAGVFAGTVRTGGSLPPSPSAPPGRVIVAINDAAQLQAAVPAVRIIRPQGR